MGRTMHDASAEGQELVCEALSWLRERDKGRSFESEACLGQDWKPNDGSSIGNVELLMKKCVPQIPASFRHEFPLTSVSLCANGDVE